MVLLCLDCGCIVVGVRIYRGWIVVGLWLDCGWIVVGIEIGLGLDFGLIVV